MIAILDGGENDRFPHNERADWAVVVKLLTSGFIETDEKAGTAAWCPCEFGTCKGACPSLKNKCDLQRPHRLKANVKAVHFAAYDFDDLTPDSFRSACATVDASGYAAVIHSSFSHTPAAPKARIVFRLSRPVLKGEWLTVWNAIPRMLGIKVNQDESCKDESRLYYLPCKRPGAVSFAGTSEGTEAIDVEAILAYGAKQTFDKAVATNLAPVEARSAVAMPAGADDNGTAVREDGSVNMEAIRTRLRRCAMPGTRELIAKMLKGSILAEPGGVNGSRGRDSTLQSLTGALVWSLPDDVPTEAMLELLRPSVLQMEPPEPGSRFETWLEFAEDMIGRARERKAVSEASRKAFADNVRAGFAQESAKIADTYAAPLVEGEAPAEPQAFAGMYTQADLAKWGGEQGVSSLDEFARRWIIQKGTSFYVFVEGRYRTPLIDKELAVSLQRDLSRAPIALQREDKHGKLTLRTPADLCDEHSTVARKVEASLCLQNSYYDPYSQTFFESVCPLRNLVPREHPEIQRWLELLGGEHAGKLIDWVASVMRLDRQSCAIYLDGPKSVGKTLLANGLARLWTPGSPAELDRVLEGFNESLVRCPLVFADESLPKRAGITAELRRFIGSTSRSLNRKFLPVVNLDGAVRVVIAGNNDRLLETGEELSVNDLDAVAGRFLHIVAPKSAADYLVALGGPPHVGRWITSDMLAEHALHLRNVRDIDEDGRFLVEGEGSAFHDHLATSSGMAGLVCEWLVRYLAAANETQKNHLLLVGEGEILVNTEALAKEASWANYVPGFKVPTAQSVGRALRGLSIGTLAAKQGERVYTYHRLKVALVQSWAQRLQIGDPAAIERRIKMPNPLIVEALKT